MSPTPHGPTDDALVDALRADLQDAQYTVAQVEQVLGPMAASALGREQPLPARRVLTGRTDPVAVLTRTFVLGDRATRSALDAALPRCGTDGAARLGLLDAAGAGAQDEVRPLLDLRPYAALDAAGAEDWWLVSDLGEVATGGVLGTDHVLGVGGASLTLAQATVRTPVGRVLDLGTGCGVQALHASRHARQVTATDVSTRALRIAGLNAGLAGVRDRVDLRLGSLLEPVVGERFDLVVSNPPFVITPRRPDVPAYDYRDGGLTGDEVVRRLVGTLADVLEPGGTAQLLGNWEVHGHDAWEVRVRQWLEGCGLDAWVVQREVQDPAEYAETWIRDGGQARGPQFDALYRAWLDDFAGRDVTAIGFGLLTLRRPADAGRPPWQRVQEHRGPVHQPLGGHLGVCLAAADRLAGLDDDALMGTRWAVAPDVTEERHHRPGEAEPAAVLLRQNSGFGRVVQVGTTVAAAVGASDGELTVGQIAGALAVLLEAPEGQLRPELAGAVRDLATDGLLLPVDD